MRHFYLLAGAGLSLLVLCSAVQAHGFEERYDLPVPLGYVVAAACATVLLTFLVAVVWVQQSDQPGNAKAVLPAPTRLGWKWLPLQFFGVLIFTLAIVCALWGTQDPLMNLAPTLVWIVWWVGLAFVVLLLGNIWPLIDPWRSLFGAVSFVFDKMGVVRGSGTYLRWPAWLGMWPAALLLLLWCWLEVVYPVATSPVKLAWLALGWSAINLTGMACVGREVWQRHADVFAIYFSTLSQASPFAARSTLAVGQVGFVMAMLAAVLFDGLHGGNAWLGFELGLKKWAPDWLDVNGYMAGTTGLIAVWLGLMAAYLLTCKLCAVLLPKSGAISGSDLASRFVPSMVPIAAGYLVAHNFSNLLIQGQRVIALLSDPMGFQWDLFGTARFYPDIAIVDAQVTWTVAVVAIVLGHVVSIWLTHREALQLGLGARRTALVTLPLTMLMMAYTALSLLVIAEPMVAHTP